MTNARQPRRAGPASDEDHVALAVVRVQPARSGTRLQAAVSLVAALVMIAMVKPWGGGAPTIPTFRTDILTVVETTPTPTEDRSAKGLAAPVCLGAGAWQVASLESWRGRAVRVWRAIEPIAVATGPEDATIPSVPVAADTLAGLGWCAPSYGSEQPVGPARVLAWQVVDGTATALFLRQVQPVGGITPIAAIYLPVNGAWAAGRVVFRYQDTGTDLTVWFAADVNILRPSPSHPPSVPSSPAVLPSPVTAPVSGPEASGATS